MSAFWKILDSLEHFYTKPTNSKGRNSGKICIKLPLLRYRHFVHNRQARENLQHQGGWDDHNRPSKKEELKNNFAVARHRSEMNQSCNRETAGSNCGAEDSLYLCHV